MLKKIIILFFVSLVVGWQLLRPGFYAMHDDLQVMRLFEMNRCFENGQIPCRWAPDLGQNYGQPLFNYYSAFPYYLGEAVHLVGFSFINTVKLLFLLSLFLSGIFIYLFSKEFLKENSALVVAIAYMTVPYHAVDIFVRGALSESWGLTLVPLVLYTVIRVCKQPKDSNAIKLSLALAALIATHNITLLISTPLILIFGLFFFAQSDDKMKQTRFIIPSVLLGVGLSAFFLLPVLLEQTFIQTKFLITDYFDFRAHFTTIGQLFTKLTWGYGPSRFNSFQYPQTLSFFIGIIQIVSISIAPLMLWIKRRDRKLFPLFLITFILSLLTLFMTHSRSVFIWDSLDALKFVQFPWRFLGPTALLTSVLIGFCLDSLSLTEERQRWATSLLIAFMIAVNFSYFRFEKYYPKMTDAIKLSGNEYDNQIKGAFLDYLPTSVKVIPESKAPALPQILDGRIDINYFDKRSNYFSSEFDVYSERGAVRFPIMDFPGWALYQNRSGVPIKFDNNNDYGLITVNLAKGHQLIQAFFEDTRLRQGANIISLISGYLIILWTLTANQKDNEN
ncbi:hypothetical protein HYU90_01195 [Candidatus Collierbacteria bacterium]|nr:hypothetical protein [Candidatus Collierbacteria bacterium]